MDVADRREMWMSVPRRVAALYAQLFEKAACVQMVTRKCPQGVSVSLLPDGKTCYIEKGAADVTDYEKRLKLLFPYVHVVERLPDDVLPELVTVKTATLNGMLTGIGNFYRWPAEGLGRVLGAGGATPLTSALTTGAINAGLGYGLGKLYNRYIAKPLHKWAPDTFSGETVAPGMLAALGATTGLVPHGLSAISAAQLKAQNGQPRDWRDYLGLSRFGYSPEGPDNPPLVGREVTAAVLDDIELDPEYLRRCRDSVKVAWAGQDRGDAGGLYTPSIPVDALNQVVWAPWLQTNPFGTKDTFGNNEQTLQAPNFNPAAAAAVTGLAAAASASQGGAPVISPADIARVAGYGVAGWATGRLAGALVGLTPGAQQTLTRNGVIGGLVYGAAKGLGLL